jgi:anaerobic C4-dicarboxylate transporter DcuA
MSVQLIVGFVVIFAALAVGARLGGVGLGLSGALGLLVISFGLGAPPTRPPGDVLLIVLAVIMAASVMEAAGGIDYLVRVAERLIRRSPRHVTIIAPLVTYAFTFLAGTGHIVYPLLPVIYEVSYASKIRPERPMAIATIASQQAITASPVSAATAAMIGILAPQGIGLLTILLICIPATLAGVLVAAIVQTRVGKELDEDPEYRRRLAAGEVEPPKVRTAGGFGPPEGAVPAMGRRSAFVFLAGVALVVAAGLFPSIRKIPGAEGAAAEISMPYAIGITMLATAAVLLLVTGTPAAKVTKTRTCEAGITAIIGILGLAWLGDTFIEAHKATIVGGLSEMARSVPALFAVGLFSASVLLYSQAATARALMPLGVTLGIPASYLIAMFPAVNGYFLMPNYGTIVAAINFDRSGTTGIGKYVLNHSFMLPGLISTITAVGVGLGIATVFFK